MRRLVTLICAGLLIASPSKSSGEESLREGADKLYREVEKRGKKVYFNIGDVHYSAFTTPSNMVVHSMVLNDGSGFEKLANYDFEEGRLEYHEVILHDRKKGQKVLEKGTSGLITNLFHKMNEFLNTK